MKRIIFSALIALIGAQVCAEIQHGKVVAGAIRVFNHSLRPIKVNGFKVKPGRALYIDPVEKHAYTSNISFSKFVMRAPDVIAINDQAVLENLCHSAYSIDLTFGFNTTMSVAIPFLDPQQPFTEYGRVFNAPSCMGCDMRGEKLEFDIRVESTWLFGQKLLVGERFKTAQL